MKIVSHVVRKQIFRAMIIGGIVGLFGVGIFLGILQASTQFSLKNDSNEVANKSNNGNTAGETIPTAGGATNGLMFFASQAGVYSNYESASSFVSEHPSLKESAIVEVDGKFYICCSLPKNVYDQLSANGATEISACGEGMEWLRISATAKEVTDPAEKQHVYSNSMYAAPDSRMKREIDTVAFFELTKVTATLYGQEQKVYTW